MDRLYMTPLRKSFLIMYSWAVPVNSRILANHIAQAQPIKSESSMGESDRMGCSSKQSHFSQLYSSSAANKKREQLEGNLIGWAVPVNSRILANKKREQLGERDSDSMKAIVIFWILISLSFLEATLPGPDRSTKEPRW